MKNILLVGPHNQEVVRTGQFLAPPLGIHRLSSNLKKEGIESKVVDPNLNYQDFINELNRNSYNYIGFSVLHPTFENDVKNIFIANEKQPHAEIISGGLGASFNFKQLLEKTPVSVVVRGFGDSTLPSIINSSSKKEWESIPAIYLMNNGEIITTKLNNQMDKKKFENLSTSLDFKSIPYEKYWDTMSQRYSTNCQKIMQNEGMIKTIRLMTSNYCPMGCSFCSSTNFLNECSNNPQKVYALESDAIIKMMKKAIESHPGVEAFYFNDDDFIFSKKRVDDFLDSLKQFNNNYNLMCMSRVDDVDGSLLKAMKKRGFKIIFYGVETFSNKVARDMNKSVKDYKTEAFNAISNSLNTGITPQMSLLLFYPTSTVSDLEETIDNSVELMSYGAISTVFPYVEAYSGANIISKHNISYKEFRIKNETFSMPDIVRPDSSEIESIAKKSIGYKKSLLSKLNSRGLYGNVPQPIDSLCLFKGVYETIGKSTKQINSLLEKMLRR